MLGDGAAVESKKKAPTIPEKEDARQKRMQKRSPANTVMSHYALAYIGVLGDGMVADSNQIL